MIDRSIDLTSQDYVAMNRADVSRRQRKRKPHGRRPVPLASLLTGQTFTTVPVPRQTVNSIMELHPSVLVLQRLKRMLVEMPGEATVAAVNSRLHYHSDSGDGRYLMAADTPVYPTS